MSVGDHITAGFRNYARFSGRTPRAEYWVFAGFLFGGLVLCFVAAPLFALVFLVGTAVPGLSAATRRMHDTGRSGKWLILPVVVMPAWMLVLAASAASALAVREDVLDDDRWFLGATALMLVVVSTCLAWLVMPSEPGHNAYGPNPREVAG